MLKRGYTTKPKSRFPVLCVAAAVAVLFLLFWLYMFTATLASDDHDEPEEEAHGLNAVASRLRRLRKSFDQSREGGRGLTAPEGVKVYMRMYESADCTGQYLQSEPSHEEALCEMCYDTCLKNFPDGSRAHLHTESVQLFVEGSWPAGWSVTLSQACHGEFAYKDKEDVKKGLTAKDGCVTVTGWAFAQWKGVAMVGDNPSAPKYHIAYSCESSTYFGYQVYANLYGFKHSGQPKGTKYTRLLTANQPDDLTELVTTFTAPRDPYSHRYAPINKPDVVTKWFESPDAPKEEVIVLIDPDNWLTGSLAKYVSLVKKGMAVAQPAFFHGNQLVQKFFDKYICKRNCGFPVATVGIPYLVHRDDLARIAPLWKELTLKTQQIFQSDPAIMEEYRSMQPDWCAEMHGYCFAAAELGIGHIVKGGLQIRDVDSRLPDWQTAKIPMIHVGRAWFPNDYQPGWKWHHTEGHDFAHFGNQVWCKCNFTAQDVVPWPIPDEGVDFVSRITLTYLHNSMAEYPPLQPSKYRRLVGPHGEGYAEAMP